MAHVNFAAPCQCEASLADPVHSEPSVAFELSDPFRDRSEPSVTFENSDPFRTVQKVTKQGVHRPPTNGEISAESLQNIVGQIVKDYNRKLDELAILTAGLPTRFHTEGCNGHKPRPASHVVDIDVCCVVPVPVHVTSQANGIIPQSPQPERMSYTMQTEDNESSYSYGAGTEDVVFTSKAELPTTKAMSILTSSSRDGAYVSSVATEAGNLAMMSQVKQSPSDSGVPSCVSNSSFPLKPLWLSGRDFWEAPSFSASKSITTRKKEAVTEAMKHADLGDFTHVEHLKGSMRYLVGSPGSGFRISWELCSFLCVLYDLIAIPLLFAFSPPPTLTSAIVNWTLLFFWTLNVPMTLTTAYIKDGILICSPSRIFKKYCRSWLVVDFLTVVPDWISAVLSLMNESDNGSLTFKFLRVLRLLRLSRLLRLVKLRNAWTMFYDMLDSETIGIVLDVLKMVMVLVLINHYVACAWFALASAQSGNNWVDAHGFTTDKVDWVHQYVVAFHWSITQFTPATMHVQPHCIGERVFTILVVILALVGFSYLVGSITGSLARLRTMSERKTQLFWLMRRFLRKNTVPALLSARITSYLETVWDHQQSHCRQSSVEALHLLSDQLKAELTLCVHSPALNVHPLLRHLQSDAVTNLTMQRLTSTGLSQVAMAPQDVVFVTGERAAHMSMVTGGIFEYTHTDSMTPEIVVSCKTWVAEPALWITEWHHVGELRSVRAAELLNIDAEIFANEVESNTIAYELVTNYAKEYVQRLNMIEKESLSDICDGDVRMVCLQSEEFGLISDCDDLENRKMGFFHIPNFTGQSPRSSLVAARESTISRTPKLTRGGSNLSWSSFAYDY